MTRRADALQVVEIRSMSAVEQRLNVVYFDSRGLVFANSAVLAERAALEDFSSDRCPSRAPDSSSALVSSTPLFATMF